MVSANNEIWHQGSFENLCGEKYDFGAFSLENEVTSSAPPAFIWATMDDGAVPARNSFVLAEAYAKAGVPCELHIYESGFHGLSTCQYDVSFDYMPSEEQLKRVAAWMPACFAFLKDKGFYPQRIK